MQIKIRASYDSFRDFRERRIAMKKIKFFIMTAILSLLTISMVIPVSASSHATIFKDVSPSDWYFGAVVYVNEKEMMLGVSKDSFDPEGKTSRAMIVTLLYRMEGSPSVNNNNSFSDVESGTWYANAVHWAAACGIVNGFEDGSFRANIPVTREQLAAIFYRYADYKGYSVNQSASLSGFSDVDQISSYAVDAVRWANREGLVNGTTTTTINPGDTSTRAQAAAILKRFCQNIMQWDVDDDWIRLEAYRQLIQTYEKEYGEAIFYTWEDKSEDMYPTAGGLYFADLMDLNHDGKDELVLSFSGRSGEDIYYQRGIDIWEYTDRGILHTIRDNPMLWYGVDLGSLYFEDYSWGTSVVIGSANISESISAIGFKDGSFGVTAQNGFYDYETDDHAYVDFGIGKPDSVNEYYVYGITNDDKQKLVETMHETKYELGL